MNPAQAVYATFMGIVAGVIYYKTDRFLYPIMVHAANNFIGAMQSFIPSKAGNLMIDMACLAMIFPMGYVLYRLFRRR